MTHLQHSEKLKRRVWQITTDARGTFDEWASKQWILIAKIERGKA